MLESVPYRVAGEPDKSPSPSARLLARRAFRAARRIVPGLGHPIHVAGDPRTPVLRRIAADAEGFRSRGELAATAGELRAVAREGGVSALFTGVVPRVARLAPSCGIVLVSYEVVKRTFGPAA